LRRGRRAAVCSSLGLQKGNPLLRLACRAFEQASEKEKGVAPKAIS